MADEMDRQQQVDERMRKKREPIMVKVQMRKVLLVKRVNCPTKNRIITVHKCKQCKDFTGVVGQNVHCKVITQEGRTVEVKE